MFVSLEKSVVKIPIFLTLFTIPDLSILLSVLIVI